MPGAVQLDWARAHGWRHYHVADAWRDYLGTEDDFWTYVTELDEAPTPERAGERLHFVCEGVDYECDLLVDNAVLHHQRGMHSRIDVDLTTFVRPRSQLAIRVYPAPKARGDLGGWDWAKEKRSQASRVTKPAISYGDDFHPRLIPLGIWQDTYFELRPAIYLRGIAARYELTNGLGEARIRVEGELSGLASGGSFVRLLLTSPSGEQVASGTIGSTDTSFQFEITLRHPRLWWPHDHGSQDVYSCRVDLADGRGTIIDQQHLRLGLRRLRLVTHEHGWDRPRDDEWPKPRCNPPTTVEVNGRAIFARGANCVPNDIFYGASTDEDYERLVRRAKDAHFNMLRIPGGGVAFKRGFYEACDRHGIMVWQDFPLACNRYPDDPAYLDLLDRESRSLICRLRQHPALAVWCGGNELFNDWSGMTDQSLALRMLNRNTMELDPDRPFLPTTPIMGMAHGPYHFRVRSRGSQTEGFLPIQDAEYTAYPEFGCPSPASLDVLLSIIPPHELFPPRPGTAWQDHGGFHALDERYDSWLGLETIEHYFGPSATLEQLVERGQLLQGVALKAVFEEARRQAPRCGIALVWCLNEPWPTAANLSLLCWGDHPKAAYYEVAAACRPVLASARFSAFQLTAGGRLDVELWLISDSAASQPEGRLEVYFGPMAAKTRVATWDFPELPPCANLRGPTVSIDLLGWDTDHVVLELCVPDHKELNSRYYFAYISGDEKPQTR